VRDAGVVGLGGAAFPTHVKLSPPPAKPVDVLVVNAAECEPFLTADERLMVEQPARVLAGCRIAARILGVTRIVVGVEDDKADEVSEFRRLASEGGAFVSVLPVRYPQGAERQLIYALTGRRVPAGGLPMDVGCVVQNVGTLAALADAVLDGRMLYERPVTVTGSVMVNPGNWRLRIGTRLRDVLRLAGGVKEDPAKIILGGPMMGLSQSSLDVPVSKGTSGVLALSRRELSQFTSEACIRCGRCLDVCPMCLNASMLSIQTENERFDLAEASRVMDCIECGCCAFICPAHRPLVQHFRRAKAEIALRRRAAAKKG
jgi:electron transport complex protein RnfC